MEDMIVDNVLKEVFNMGIKDLNFVSNLADVMKWNP